MYLLSFIIHNTIVYLSYSLPSVEHINERAVCNAIAPEKDVDGFHIVNIGKMCLDQRSMVPATPAAVWEIIKRAGKPQNSSALLLITDFLTVLQTDNPVGGSEDLWIDWSWKWLFLKVFFSATCFFCVKHYFTVF